MPGDKSISHRALILSAMTKGQSRIRGLLDSEDVLATAAAVEALGARIEKDGAEWRVDGGPWHSPEAAIDCGNSGTTARLLMGAAAGVEGLQAKFIGDASLSRRPMRRITNPLARMGARFDGSDHLPITLYGQRLGGIDHVGRVASAQVKSALLFAGLGSSGPVRILEPVPSRDHGEVMLLQFGVEVEAELLPEGWCVRLGEKRTLEPTEIEVPADPSSAAFLWAAAAMIEGASVTTPGVCINAGRTGFLESIERMGARVEIDAERIQSGEPVGDVTVHHGPLQPIHLAAEQVPSTIDEIPLLACVAACADGESHFEGLGELRHKESDRLGAVAAGLTANGVSVFPEPDALRILGRGEVRGGGMVMAHGDHRIAMAFLTLGLAARQPVTLDDGSSIAVSFPGFAEVMCSLGAEMEEEA